MEASRLNLATRLWQSVTGDVQVIGPSTGTNLSSVTLSERELEPTPDLFTRIRLYPVLHESLMDSYSRSEGTEVTTGEFQDSLVVLRDTVIEEELILPGERRIAIGVAPPSDVPANLDATLSPPSAIICRNTMPERNAVLARLGEHLGVIFILRGGPGLPDMRRQVLSDFTTLNRKAGEVLDDLVLNSGARIWKSGSTVTIDGRQLPEGALLPSIRSVTDLQRVFVRGGEYAPVTPEPDPGDDPDETFETMDDAEHSWVEHLHAGEDSQEIHYRLVKEAGSLVLEEERRYGYVQTLSGPQWVQVYHVLKEHEYLPYCRDAMIRSVETVRQARTDMTYWTIRIAPGEVVEHVRDWAPELMMTSRKMVTQRWHAEGWLRLRSEVTDEAAGFVQSFFDGSPIGEIAYKRTTRSEEWTPTGGGQWLQRVTEHIPTNRPVYEVESDSSHTAVATYEVVATYPIAQVRSFSRPTDSPPPQLSCPGLNPETVCEDRSEEDLSEAQAVNDPDRYVVTLTLPGLAFGYSVGDMLPGGAYVTEVRFTYTPEAAETELELWLRP